LAFFEEKHVPPHNNTKSTFEPDNVDIRLLKENVRFGWMSGEQLSDFLFLPSRPVPARITRLVQHGFLVTCDEFRIRPLYFATHLGARWAGLGLQAIRQIDRNDVYHDLSVVDLAHYVTAREPGSRWISERQLRSVAARRMRQFRFTERGHYPDGMLIDADGRRIAMELELSKKSPWRYRRILRWYAEQPEIAGLRWYIGMPSIRKLLERIMHENDLVIGDGMTILDLPSEVGRRR
jgi:hypothetical protein